MEYRKLSNAAGKVCQYYVNGAEQVDNCDKGICFYAHQHSANIWTCRRFTKPLDVRPFGYFVLSHDFECGGPFGLGGSKRE